jgi:hypothetical protein
MTHKPYFGTVLSLALLANPLLAQTQAKVEHVLCRLRSCARLP